MSLKVEEFKSKYFCKSTLIKLCRSYGIPTYGTKAELNSYILQYLSGVPVSGIRQARHPNSRKALTADEINLNTPLVGSGFKFNQDTRKFFGHYLGVDHFSFTKQMATMMRQAEIENNQRLTVGDLLHLKSYENLKIPLNSPEESTYQWNAFVKDLCNDPASSNFTSRIKVAAILWQKVKLSDGPKKYCHQLLTRYASLINNAKNGDSHL